jgi:hypothetical protein
MYVRNIFSKLNNEVVFVCPFITLEKRQSSYQHSSMFFFGVLSIPE